MYNTTEVQTLMMKMIIIIIIIIIIVIIDKNTILSKAQQSLHFCTKRDKEIGPINFYDSLYQGHFEISSTPSSYLEDFAINVGLEPIVPINMILNVCHQGLQ